MSQIVTRKRTGGDEKEKSQADSPVKDMKKKMAANAEKEKNAAEKVTDKNSEKPAEKSTDKPADKPADKSDKPKPADKAPEKPPEKKVEKPAEKKSDAHTEKKKEDSSKGESSAKTDKPDQKKHDTRDKPKQNGSSNGVNGTVSGGGDSDSDELVIDENDENDEIFPELAYDDSDVEWEPGMDVCPSRSLTRRSQVKLTRTPETPRPASDKQPESAGAGDESKDSKVLKLHQESKTSDSPKPETRKAEPKPDTRKSEAKPDTKKAEAKPETKKAEAPKSDAKQDTPKPDASKETKESPKEVKEGKDTKEPPKKEEGKEDKSDKVEVEVVVDIEHSSDPSESRKPDTNFSKSRVKVSPYRRSLRLADQTTSSITANYTGNNTTMEMDITESSSILEGSLDDSSYLGGLRSIRGRRSYKTLQEMTLRQAPASRSQLSAASLTVSEHSSRPTGTVVGRKRKPDGADFSWASEAEEAPLAGKRQRLLDRIARPFRRSVAPARLNAEIVGINTDLPLTAPVASAETYDPETLKAVDPAPLPAPVTPLATPEESKRCVVM